MPWTRLEHTADLAVEVRADSWPGLLGEGVRAFAALVCEAPPAPRSGAPERSLCVEGRDAVETWVQWWRGLHRLWSVDALLPLMASVSSSADPASAEGVVRCEEASRIDLDLCFDLKAVTWHRAAAEQQPDGSWRGRIVVDV